MSDELQLALTVLAWTLIAVIAALGSLAVYLSWQSVLHQRRIRRLHDERIARMREGRRQ